MDNDMINEHIKSLEKWYIVVKISLLHKERYSSISNLARKINESPTNPLFNDIINVLKNDDIIIETEQIGRNQGIEIKIIKVREIAEKSKFFTIPEWFIHKKSKFKIT